MVNSRTICKTKSTTILLAVISHRAAPNTWLHQIEMTTFSKTTSHKSLSRSLVSVHHSSSSICNSHHSSPTISATLRIQTSNFLSTKLFTNLKSKLGFEQTEEMTLTNSLASKSRYMLKLQTHHNRLLLWT